MLFLIRAWLFVIVLLIIWVILSSEKAEKRKIKLEKARQLKLQNLLNSLDYVKVLGTRRAVNTVLNRLTETNVNSTLYSLLLVFKDGTQQTSEVGQEEINAFANYIRT